MTKAKSDDAPAAGPYDEFKLILDQLVANQTITADVAGLIKLALDHKAGK